MKLITVLALIVLAVAVYGAEEKKAAASIAKSATVPAVATGVDAAKANETTEDVEGRIGFGRGFGGHRGGFGGGYGGGYGGFRGGYGGGYGGHRGGFYG